MLIIGKIILENLDIKMYEWIEFLKYIVDIILNLLVVLS